MKYKVIVTLEGNNKHEELFDNRTQVEMYLIQINAGLKDYVLKTEVLEVPSEN